MDGPLVIRSRAPLRLGLAGGGTDVSPFSDIYGGNVLNATIDMYANCTLEVNRTDKIQLVATDRNEKFECDLTAHIEPEGELRLHKGVYNRIMRQFNAGRPLGIAITTYTDVPAGSGLGSSSTLVVAMIKAFVELLNLPLGEYEIAHLAFEIERIELGCAGGKQDQYAATFGGFNFIEFYKDDRVVVNPLRVKNWIISELESSLMLYYTGVSRYSSEIIAEQAKNAENNVVDAVAAMTELKEQAVKMKEAILKGDMRSLAGFMERSWEAKKKTAASISNSEIDALHDRARAAGAYAGKLSGAGGGGFMMFLVDPSRRMEVIRALNSHEGRVMSCHFTKHGTQGWRLPQDRAKNG